MSASTGEARHSNRPGGCTSCRVYDVLTMSVSPSRTSTRRWGSSSASGSRSTEGAHGAGGHLPGHGHRHPRLPYRDRDAPDPRGRTLARAVQVRAARPRAGVPGRDGQRAWSAQHCAFEVEDLPAEVARLAADGYDLVGGIGEYEGTWRMAYVRRPEEIIVSLAERIG